MKDEKTVETDGSGCCGPEASREVAAGCPMASMCSGFLEKGTSRFLLMLPGVLLILLGVAILVQPQVLVWLVAGAAVLLGIAMLLMAHIMYRFGAKARGAGG
jgi:uncharacterized membrane protein HdeD (DUF308 family)